MEILTSYYSNLLGTTFSPTWRFTLDSIYPSPITQLRTLDTPFSDQEISDAFLHMHQTASSGPDGFGPGFYRLFWGGVVKPRILRLFNHFFHNNANLDAINRAYMVLSPNMKGREHRKPLGLSPSKIVQ